MHWCDKPQFGKAVPAGRSCSCHEMKLDSAHVGNGISTQCGAWARFAGVSVNDFPDGYLEDFWRNVENRTGRTYGYPDKSQATSWSQSTSQAIVEEWSTSETSVQ